MFYLPDISKIHWITLKDLDAENANLVRLLMILSILLVNVKPVQKVCFQMVNEPPVFFANQMK